MLIYGDISGETADGKKYFSHDGSGNKELRKQNGGIMKEHKYWSVCALLCMIGAFISGYRKHISSHKLFSAGSLLCMMMSIYSGHKLTSKKQKKD